jgi:peptide/nickel transport system permease protein
LPPEAALAVPPARRRHPVARFFGRRLAAGLVTLLVAITLIFASLQVLPGDVASAVLGPRATPERVAAIHESLGLDKPLPGRYAHFLGKLVTGDFGESSAGLAQGQHLGVWNAIKTPLTNSLVLAGITMALFIPLCLALALAAARRAGRKVDQAISLPALALGAMPEFLVGTLLILVFFTQFNLLPPVSQIGPGETPFSDPKKLILPVATLLCVSAAFGIRLLRASLVEVLREDYVAMARLNGQSEQRVVLHYALRNALGPAIQVIAQMVLYLVGGIVVTESVFNYPGIGSKLVQAVSARDVQEVAVITALLASFYIIVNILADLAAVLAVPRLRTQL